jgi:hypothetical protein
VQGHNASHRPHAPRHPAAQSHAPAHKTPHAASHKPAHAPTHKPAHAPSHKPAMAPVHKPAARPHHGPASAHTTSSHPAPRQGGFKPAGGRKQWGPASRNQSGKSGNPHGRSRFGR